MKMWIYIVRRLVLLIPVIIGVMTITFLLLSSLSVQQQIIAHFGEPPRQNPTEYNQYLPCPGNRSQQCLNPIYVKLTKQLGLNQPAPVQWGYYLYRSFTFQWGTVANQSTAGQAIRVAEGQPVVTVLGWFLPYTLELAALSLAIILAVALPLGNLAAVNRNRPVDQVARVMSFSGFALPGFLLSALVLMGTVLAISSVTGAVVHTPWCPSGEATWLEFWGSWPSNSCFPGGQYPLWMHGGYQTSPTGFPTVDALLHHQYWLAADSLLRMALPALVIAFGSVAILLRFVRNSMLEVMNLDFVRTARAEGIPEQRVIKRHAGRNSLNVTVTVLGLTFAFFIGGFPIIEDVFHLRGVGLMLQLAASSSNGSIDFALVFGSTLLFTFIVVIANIIVDVIYAYLDPRVRLG